MKTSRPKGENPFSKSSTVERLTFASLSQVREDDLIALMNNEDVGRHLPLLSGGFSRDDCRAFLRAKQALWDRYGYGPWAFFIDGTFAGWGGLQPEQRDADFALILHPDYWGWGRRIFKKVLEQAFGPAGRDDITVLLPPGRSNAKAVLRLGFVEEAPVIVAREVFRRFRLTKQRYRARQTNTGSI